MEQLAILLNKLNLWIKWDVFWISAAEWLSIIGVIIFI